jgi:hypothetical protein
MFKKRNIIILILFTCGCNPSTKYTTHQEYIENRRMDPEKGWTRDFEASYEVEWEN